MSVSSCICCMLVSCAHPVTVLNAAFLQLLMLVDDARVDHYGLQSLSHDCLLGSHESLFLFTLFCSGEYFY